MRKSPPDTSRGTFINTICHYENFPCHTVVSAIQGLYHVSHEGDEKYLIPLLTCHDKTIAGAALSELSVHYPDLPFLRELIVEFASTYPAGDDEDNELQTNALFALGRLATTDINMLKNLVRITDCYNDLGDSLEALCANATAWEVLAKSCNIKLRGEESRELLWNPHSAMSDGIRDKIRKAIESVLL